MSSVPRRPTGTIAASALSARRKPPPLKSNSSPVSERVSSGKMDDAEASLEQGYRLLERLSGAGAITAVDRDKPGEPGAPSRKRE